MSVLSLVEVFLRKEKTILSILTIWIKNKQKELVNLPREPILTVEVDIHFLFIFLTYNFNSQRVIDLP